MAVSVNWGVYVLGVHITRALLFGVYIRAADFWKLPYIMYYIPYTIYSISYTIYTTFSAPHVLKLPCKVFSRDPRPDQGDQTKGRPRVGIVMQSESRSKTDIDIDDTDIRI